MNKNYSMENKLNELNDLYSHSVVDFSVDGSTTIGIIEGFRMVDGVPCAVCSYTLDVFDDNTYIIESSNENGEKLHIELTENDFNNLSCGNNIVDEDDFIDIIKSLDHSKYAFGVFNRLSSYDELLEDDEDLLYEEFYDVLKPYSLKCDVDAVSVDTKYIHSSLNGLKRKCIMFEYLGTVYVGEVMKARLSKWEDSLEIDFAFLFKFDDDGMWCLKNEKVLVCDNHCIDFCLNLEKLVCGRNEILNAMRLLSSYSFYQKMMVDDMFSSAQEYYETLLDSEDDEIDSDVDNDAYFNELINGELVHISMTTRMCNTRQKRVIDKFMRRFFGNEHYQELCEYTTSICDCQIDPYGKESFMLSFYNYDEWGDDAEIDEIDLFVNYEGGDISFYCSYGDGYLTLMTKGKLDDMLNFVWKKLSGEKILESDGHMRYLFNASAKVNTKIFNMYVDMLEENYSERGVVIDRSRIDFSSTNTANNSILNLLREQVDNVYELK